MTRRRTATQWHVTREDALSYAIGSLAETDCWSLEKHLEACSSCAGRVSEAVRAGEAAPQLARTRSALMSLATAEARPRTGRAGVAALRAQALRAHAVPPAWAAGPALRLPWLLALVAVAALAVVMARLGEIGGARPVLLALAPVLPLAGPALSYGRYADPLHEVAASTPSGGLRLLLIRTATVLGVSMPLLTLTGVLLPAAPGAPGAATWLLPGLALTLATLVLGSYTGCRAAAAGISATWLASVLLASRSGLVPGSGGGTPGEPPFVTALAQALTSALAGPAAQGGWAAAAVLCAGLLALRRTSFDYLEKM
jgi:hypothetical protein